MFFIQMQHLKCLLHTYLPPTILQPTYLPTHPPTYLYTTNLPTYILTTYLPIHPPRCTIYLLVDLPTHPTTQLPCPTTYLPS